MIPALMTAVFLPTARQRLILLCCCSLLIFAGNVQAADPPVLRWGMDHFPGFDEFHGNSCQPVGPSVEMMQQ
ncbi:MAG: hypothetical protein U5L02_15975 [Rheinheimera sp.]|nr:hypothetical protein [Rheinheimera sp.]